MLDDARSEIIKNQKNIHLTDKKRILHIANFNENSDGRLFYSFANKLNNGLNKNEIQLISKSRENKGFFEKFFQLFS